MAKKRAQKDYEQFSKRLSKWLLIFWAIYRVFTLAASFARPEVVTGLTALTTGVDDAAMCVVISYTVNSATEKVATKYFAARTVGLANDDKEEEDDSNG